MSDDGVKHGLLWDRLFTPHPISFIQPESLAMTKNFLIRYLHIFCMLWSQLNLQATRSWRAERKFIGMLIKSLAIKHKRSTSGIMNKIWIYVYKSVVMSIKIWDRERKIFAQKCHRFHVKDLFLEAWRRNEILWNVFA